MPVERHVLLPAACGSGPMELMLLPAGEDALEEHQYQAMLAGGARLHWRHHSSDLSWQPPNQLASRLAQTQVWGDATLVLPPRPEPELRQQVQQIAAAHLPGVQCRLSGGWAADGDARGVDAAGRERRGRRQQEQLLRMLRRSAGGPEEPCMSAASAAPPTPASQGPSAGHATQQQRPSTTSSVPAEQEHEARVYECEPRQQLLWSIAGRATSLSWQCSAGTAAAGSAGVPAAAASTAPLAAAACLPSKAPEPDSTAKAPAAAAVLPPKHRCSLDSHPPWAELQPELLAVVLAHAGHSANAGRTLTQVCSGWRRGLGEERSALQQLRFNQLELQQGGSSSDSGGGSSGSRSARLPWLVERSVRAGNVAATVAAARWTERCQLQQHGRTGPQLSARAAAAAARAAGTWYGGCEAAASAVAAAAAGGAASSEGAADAARYWKKAAKLGHPEAQWKLGWGHYKGLMGLAHDGEEAFLWLSRCAKQLAELVALDPSQPSGGSGCTAEKVGSGTALPALMSEAGCRHIFAQAAHILGYLCLDGEGTKADVTAALRWFRLAERHGCREAARVVGSLLNTGMYG